MKRKRRKFRSYKPGMFRHRAREAPAREDYDSPSSALASVASRIGAEWYVKSGDDVAVYMRSRDGYRVARLFKKGGWYHWPTDWSEEVRNLPAGARRVPNAERIAAEGSADDRGHSPGEYRELIWDLQHQGWRVEPTKQGHYKAFPPDPNMPMVLFSTNPGAKKKVLSQLRRSGYHDERRAAEAPEDEGFENAGDAIVYAYTHYGATHWREKRGMHPVVYALDPKGEWWLEWPLKYSYGRFYIPPVAKKADPWPSDAPLGTLPKDARLIESTGAPPPRGARLPLRSLPGGGGGGPRPPPGYLRRVKEAAEGSDEWPDEGGVVAEVEIDGKKTEVYALRLGRRDNRPGSGPIVFRTGGELQVREEGRWRMMGSLGQSRIGIARRLKKEFQGWIDSDTEVPLRAEEARKSKKNRVHEAAEQSEPSGEAAAVPWVKLERDPEQYAKQVAFAQAVGKIDSARAVYDMLAPSLAKEDQEVFIVIGVDIRGQCRGPTEVHRGARSRVSVDVPEILRVANALGGEMFIVVHNHPTTHATPSAADKSLTKAIEKAARATEQVMMDHVIIGMGEYFSFAENKLTKVGAKRETRTKPTRGAPPAANEEPVAGGYTEHAFFVAPRYTPGWLIADQPRASPSPYLGSRSAGPTGDWELIEVGYSAGPEEWEAIGFSGKKRDVDHLVESMRYPLAGGKYYARGARSDTFGRHTRSWLDLFTPLHNGSPIWWFGHGGKPERPATLIDFHKYKQGSSLGKKKGSFYAMSYADFESGNWPAEVEKLGAWEGDGARETSLPGGEPDIEFIVAPVGPIPAWLTMSNRSSARPDRVATRIRLEDLEEIFREDGSDAVTISTPESRAIWFSNVLTDENPEILALAVYSSALKWFQRGERFVHYGKGANKYGTWAGMKLRKKETIRDLLQAITVVEQDTYSTVWLYDLEKMKPERVLTMWELIQPFGPAGSTPEPHWTTNSYERDGGISFRDEKGKTLWPLSERQWEEGEWPPESEGGPPAAKYGMEPTG